MSDADRDGVSAALFLSFLTELKSMKFEWKLPLTKQLLTLPWAVFIDQNAIDAILVFPSLHTGACGLHSLILFSFPFRSKRIVNVAEINSRKCANQSQSVRALTKHVPTNPTSDHTHPHWVRPLRSDWPSHLPLKATLTTSSYFSCFISVSPIVSQLDLSFSSPFEVGGSNAQPTFPYEWI